jgi:hypothetical protein
MAFNGDGQKFIGDDAALYKASFGAEVAGNGVAALTAPGVYMIIAVASTSGFPAAAGTGSDPAVGDVLVLKALDSVTPEVGDDVVTLTLTEQCDVSSWTKEFTKEEVNVTTLCDTVMTYRAGKADMSGSITGITVAGTTDSTTGLMRQFLPIVRQDADTSFDRYDQQEEIFLGFFYINDDTNLADEMYIVAFVQLFGYSLGGEMGSAQGFTSNFRYASSSYTSAASVQVTPTPTFYRLGS